MKRTLVAAVPPWSCDTGDRADRPGPRHADHRPGPPRPGDRPAVEGQFAENLGRGIYDGIWVGPHSSIPNRNGYRTDVMKALKALHVPVIRWPGGCFADTYDWRDGIARRQRPKGINTNWAVSPTTTAPVPEFIDYSVAWARRPMSRWTSARCQPTVRGNGCST